MLVVLSVWHFRHNKLTNIWLLSSVRHIFTLNQVKVSADFWVWTVKSSRWYPSPDTYIQKTLNSDISLLSHLRYELHSVPTRQLTRHDWSQKYLKSYHSDVHNNQTIIQLRPTRQHEILRRRYSNRGREWRGHGTTSPRLKSTLRVKRFGVTASHQRTTLQKETEGN